MPPTQARSLEGLTISRVGGLTDVAINSDSARHRCYAYVCALESSFWYFGVCKTDKSAGDTFQRESVGGLSMRAFADADYASKVTDRGSISGGDSDVWWFLCVLVSRTQICVKRPTTETE